METGEKNKIIKDFRKLFLPEDGRYVFKRVDFTKGKSEKKSRFIVKTMGIASVATDRDHALNLLSYLELVVPRRFHTHLNRCDFFYLIRGDEKEAFNFLRQSGYQKALAIKNRFAKNRFERFFISYNKRNDEWCCGFYNIASQQRLQHYLLLLKLIYGQKLRKKLYQVLYPNKYLKQLAKTIKRCKEAQKIIVGYKENIKSAIQKRSGRNPDIDMEDDYFSIAYYRKEKLIVAGHAFGWMMKEILSLIVQQTKIKQLFYIGNCGALNKFKIGRVLFPKNLFYSGRRRLVIKNILALKNDEFGRHLSVPTPLIETNKFIEKIRKDFLTVDVELYDIVHTVLRNKANLSLGIVLLVSDRPGKKENSALVSDEYRFQRSLSNAVERVVRLAMSE